MAQISKVDAGPLMHLFNSQPRTLYDLLEVRSLLEAESARLAAARHRGGFHHDPPSL